MVIRCSSDVLPGDACLFIEVVVDGPQVLKTKTLTLEHESTVSSWRLDETIELWVFLYFIDAIWAGCTASLYPLDIDE